MPQRSLARRAAASLPPVRRLLEERDELRREVERLRAAPPVSAGGDVPGHRRDDYDYVFVMTYGRSGSTLLQGILNSTPGVMIRGENRGITYRLFEYHQSAVKDASWIGDVGRRKVNPFFGIRDYPAELALTRFRELILDTLLRPKPATTMVGFKEIRWYQDDLADYVEFLREVFPGARFIVNTRRLEDVAKSSWMANREDPLGDLQVIEKRILDVAAGLGPVAFHVRYDEYVEDPTRLRGLFDWLGLEFDEARVRTAMEFDYARMPDSPKPRDTAS
jgi:hypothetical protein